MGSPVAEVLEPSIDLPASPGDWRTFGPTPARNDASGLIDRLDHSGDNQSRPAIPKRRNRPMASLFPGDASTLNLKRLVLESDDLAAQVPPQRLSAGRDSSRP
jgi:hypothetical protein